MANDITRWNPTDDVRQMQRFMDRFLGWPRLAREDVEFESSESMLPVDIFEKDGNVVVKAALPGLKPEESQVNIADDMLHIRAETKTEQDVNDENYHRREYRYGKFSRSFRLPPNLDTAKATANYENGMLRLTFPRTEAAKPRAIQVKVQ